MSFRHYTFDHYCTFKYLFNRKPIIFFLYTVEKAMTSYKKHGISAFNVFFFNKYFYLCFVV